MIVLGIESTAHTFGVGIAEKKNGKGRIIANVKDSYRTMQGGIIPNELANHHIEICDSVIKEALEKASVNLSDIDAVAVSQGPGMGHALRIGMIAARTLAIKLNKPLIGVNHCVAHLEIGRLLTKAKDPVMLYASGANTQIIAFEGGRYRIFGETLDMGIGNFLDTLAREMSLGFPGGPKIDELAKKGKRYITTPYVIKGMDFGFGGILTHLKKKLREGFSKQDIAYSTQETVFAMLIEASERAMAHCQKKELLLGGGVACNRRLQEMAGTMCRERKSEFYVPENEFLVDNGAMIAWLGLVKYRSASAKGTKEEFSPERIAIRPYERTEEVEVYWRD